MINEQEWICISSYSTIFIYLHFTVIYFHGKYFILFLKNQYLRTRSMKLSKFLNRFYDRKAMKCQVRYIHASGKMREVELFSSWADMERMGRMILMGWHQHPEEQENTCNAVIAITCFRSPICLQGLVLTELPCIPWSPIHFSAGPEIFKYVSHKSAKIKGSIHVSDT